MNETVEKGKRLKQQGILVCGSSVAIFGPVLAMMTRRGNANPVILYVLFACWAFDLVLGIFFIVRGNKLIEQGSERNG